MTAAFYCMSSSRYFLGAIGLINSVRMVGHDEPIFLLDCGLTGEQRELLAPQVTLVPSPPIAEPEPFLLKTVAPLAHPAEVTVMIDVDMIVTRPLTELIERASRGGVVAFEGADVERSFPEWGELLDLGPIRPQPYASSSLVLLGGSVGPRVLDLMDDRQSRASYSLSFFDRDVPDYPFRFLDQDVLNAILASRVEPDSVAVLERRLAAPAPFFDQLRLVDGGGLRCRYGDGTEPYVLHQFFWKPWIVPMPTSIYSRLLQRLLVGPGLAIEVPEPQIPLRLRGGPLAAAERRRVNARHHLRRYVRRPLSSLVRRLSGRPSGGKR